MTTMINTPPFDEDVLQSELNEAQQSDAPQEINEHAPPSNPAQEGQLSDDNSNNNNHIDISSKTSTPLSSRHTSIEMPVHIEKTNEAIPAPNFECLDYAKIYSESYRAEFYKNDNNIRRSYEWRRWVLSFVIAVFMGVVAYGVKTIITKILDLKFKIVEEQMEKGDVGYYALAYVIFAAVNIALSVLSSSIVVFFEPSAAGSGIPEVKAYLNGTKIPHFLRIRTLIAKLTSVMLANGAGLPVGTEGPMIHMGAVAANIVSSAHSKELHFKIPFMKHFRNDRDKRDFIISGAGTGFAAAFGTPLGGTLFAFEEVSAFWSTLLTWRTFFTCLIAVFTSNVLLRTQTGEYINSRIPIFNVGPTLSYQPLELIPFVVIGIVGGFIGAMFTAMNLAVNRMRKTVINKTPMRRVCEVAAIALVYSTFQFLLPFAFQCKDIPTSCLPDSNSFTSSMNCTTLMRHYCKEGQYNDLASTLFNSNENAVLNLLKVGDTNLLSLPSVIVFFLCYVLGAGYTAGAGISIGLFVPMVMMGGAYGRIVGLILIKLCGLQFPDVGVFAIVGVAAFMGGVSRLTVSLTVILIEITNNLTYLLPIMLTVLTAKLTADFINNPLFECQIETKNIPFLKPNPVKEMNILMCKHIMADNPKYFMEKDTVGNIVRVLKETHHNGFPVVSNQNEKVKGIILRAQLLVILDRVSACINKSEILYSHYEYQTKLARKLPKLQHTECDYTEIDLTPFYSVSEEFPVCEAFQVFRTMGLRHLIVVGENNEIKGMITKKDLEENKCIAKYDELERLKKDLPDQGQERELNSMPGTPAESESLQPSNVGLSGTSISLFSSSVS